MIITRKIVSDNKWDSPHGPAISLVFTQSENGYLDLMYQEKIAYLYEFSNGIEKSELYKIITDIQSRCMDKLKGSYVLFAREAQIKHEVTEAEEDILRGLRAKEETHKEA